MSVTKTDGVVSAEESTTQVDATATATDSVTTQVVTPQAFTTDARAEERTRIAGITTCVEATDKSKLANHLALNTSLSLDEAKDILKYANVETAPKSESANAFANAMETTGNPNVGADTSGGTLTRAQEIIQAQNRATGN